MRGQRTTLLLAISAGVLGLGHLALTGLLYPEWSTDSLWFVGTGLAMLIGAGSNLLGIGVEGRGRRAGLVCINLAMTLFFASAWSVLPEPQVIVGGVLFAGLAIRAGWFGSIARKPGTPGAS